MELKLFTQENPIGIEISESLNSGRYNNFKMAIAYAKNSGIGRLHDVLRGFSNNGGVTEAIVGIDQNITSYQALVNLSTFTGSSLYIHHDKGSISFHPKMYLFGNDTIEKVIIGSSNLTSGGLYLNFEANVGIELDGTSSSVDFRNQVTNYWNFLVNDHNTKIASLPFINKLLELGYLLDENKQKSFKDIIAKVSKAPFGSRRQPQLPPISIQVATDSPSLASNFAMLLSGFDVSPKSQDPVVLIPKKALQSFPTFWNWPNFYTQSGSGYPQFYAYAEIHLDGRIITGHYMRIYYYDTKKEFRLQCEPIKRNGNQGDIILIKKNDLKPLEFIIELIRKNSPKYNALFPKLTERVSPLKRYSYF